MVSKSESRQGSGVRLIGIHTNEGDNPANVFPDRTAENLAGYLDREKESGRSKSYHRICDDDSTVIYVPDSQAAWAMPYGGNLPALQLCFTGWGPPVAAAGDLGIGAADADGQGLDDNGSQVGGGLGDIVELG